MLVYNWYFDEYIPQKTKEQTVEISVLYENNSILKGTGFVINGNEIVTNQHVVRNNPKKIEVNFFNSGRYEATIKTYDINRDLAIIQTKTPISDNFSSILCSNYYSYNEEFYTIGHPLGITFLYTKMYISSFQKQGDPIKNTVNSNILPGNSGGAMFDSYGRVRGVISETGYNDGEYIGYGFNITSKELCGFLKENNIKYDEIYSMKQLYNQVKYKISQFLKVVEQS